MSAKTETKLAAMVADARLAVRNVTHWYSSSELLAQAKAQGLSTVPAPSEWTRQRRLLALELDGEQRFPAYAFDSKGWQPLPAMAAILNILAGRDVWFVALWFEACNSYLGVACPRQVLAQDPVRVILAAQAEAAGIDHG